MDIWLSFPYDSFKSTADAFEFIINDTLFHKEGILSSIDNKGYIDFDKDKIVKYLDENQLESFNLVSNYSLNFEFENSVTFRRNSFTNLNIFCISIQGFSELNFEGLISASLKKGFTMCILFDLSKSNWQNEIIVSNYKTFKKPYEHLPKIWDRRISPMLGEVIDISKNPGHYKETYSIVLMAAPGIWFGPNCWQFFDKKNVLSYQDAMEVKEIIPEVVYVKLFDWDTTDYETAEILSKQKSFRKWTKMDEIEESLNKLLES
jgi:hypothetical protein